MDSYRPHSRAGHRFCTFHMFVDELCLQLVGDYRTAVHRQTRAKQFDLLCLQGMRQHQPERSPAATGNNLCVVCCTKYNKYLKKHPATAYRNMPNKWRKTTFCCSTCKGARCQGTLLHTHSGPGYLPGPSDEPRTTPSFTTTRVGGSPCGPG